MVLCGCQHKIEHKIDQIRALPNCLKGCRCCLLVSRKKSVPRNEGDRTKSIGEEGKAEKDEQHQQHNNENYYCSVEEMAYDAMYEQMPTATTEEERDKTGTVLQRVAMALQGKAGPTHYQQFK